MKIYLSIILLLFLGACTTGQLYATVEERAGAGKAYLGEQVMVRQEYRAKERASVNAEYSAEMRAADEAERVGDMEKAKTHWAAARVVLKKHMPTLQAIRQKVGDFFDPPATDPNIAPE